MCQRPEEELAPIQGLSQPAASPPPVIQGLAEMRREAEQWGRPAAPPARWENGQAPAGQRLPAINARWQASKPQTGGDTYTPRWLQIRAALMGIKGWWVSEAKVG